MLRVPSNRPIIKPISTSGTNLRPRTVHAFLCSNEKLIVPLPWIDSNHYTRRGIEITNTFPFVIGALCVIAPHRRAALVKYIRPII
jgi:hypothetical protein